MGALLVAGAIVLVAAIVYKASRLKKAPSVQGFKLETRLPAGTRVVETLVDGDRLLVRIKSDDGGQIIIYDLRRGRETGRIFLKQ